MTDLIFDKSFSQEEIQQRLLIAIHNVRMARLATAFLDRMPVDYTSCTLTRTWYNLDRRIKNARSK